MNDDDPWRDPDEPYVEKAPLAERIGWWIICLLICILFWKLVWNFFTH